MFTPVVKSRVSAAGPIGRRGLGWSRLGRFLLWFDRGRSLISFLNRESVTIALLFSGLMLFLSSTAPSLLHSTLFVVGLTSVWVAILTTGVNRL